MTDIYMYADETGNLDYGDKPGASRYFGFGTATFGGDHGAQMFTGMKLRAELQGNGLSLPNGFHAVKDANRTKVDMFQEVQRQAPRFDFTFLCKENAYPSVRAAGQMRLYKLAWFMHFKEVAVRTSNVGDTLYVVAGTFGTNARAAAAVEALNDVCRQVNRKVVLCVWNAPTSWGIQVADYGLWAAQRVLEGKPCSWYDNCVKPSTQTMFLPWGRAK